MIRSPAHWRTSLAELNMGNQLIALALNAAAAAQVVELSNPVSSLVTPIMTVPSRV